MTDQVISPLRRRMIEDAAIRKLAPKAQHDYVQKAKDFATFLGRSPPTWPNRRTCAASGCIWRRPACAPPGDRPRRRLDGGSVPQSRIGTLRPHRLPRRARAACPSGGNRSAPRHYQSAIVIRYGPTVTPCRARPPNNRRRLFDFAQSESSGCDTRATCAQVGDSSDAQFENADRLSRSEAIAVAIGATAMSEPCLVSNDIFIVDDDADVCNTLAMAFSIEGYRVTIFMNGTSFIATAQARTPACVLLDVCMPAKSGLDLLKELDARSYPAPIFIMSGRGDIPTAVEAINDGAYDFIEKRLGTESIVAQVRETIEGWNRPKRNFKHQRPSLSFPGCERLTPRERDVLDEIMTAASSKETARNLGTSPRTIENHRVNIMHKLGAKNTVDLARMIFGKGNSGR
jgi:two-component system response regulator FixJ